MILKEMKRCKMKIKKMKKMESNKKKARKKKMKQLVKSVKNLKVQTLIQELKKCLNQKKTINISQIQIKMMTKPIN